MKENFTALDAYKNRRKPFTVTEQMKKDAKEKEKEEILIDEGLLEEQLSMQPSKRQREINKKNLRDDH
jgi:hypothetical protein